MQQFAMPLNYQATIPMVAESVRQPWLTFRRQLSAQGRGRSEWPAKPRIRPAP